MRSTCLGSDGRRVVACAFPADGFPFEKHLAMLAVFKQVAAS